MRLARVRALIIFSALALIATGTAAWAITHDSQDGAAGCPAGSLVVNLDMPDAEDVEVRVFNGTKTPGLAEQVKGELEEYGYEVIEIGTKKDAEVKTSAEVHYGPSSVGAGHVLTAYFLNSTGVFDKDREDAVVDVIIGSGFQQVNTESEKIQALGVLGRPQAPTGTCAA